MKKMERDLVKSTETDIVQLDGNDTDTSSSISSFSASSSSEESAFSSESDNEEVESLAVSRVNYNAIAQSVKQCWPNLLKFLDQKGRVNLLSHSNI